MKLEKLHKICKEKTVNVSDIEKLKEWYKGFLFGYSKYARIEDEGSISEKDRKSLESYDFELAKQIVENRYGIYQKEIISDINVESALLKTQEQRQIAKDTLAPIISDLEAILASN